MHAGQLDHRAELQPWNAGRGSPFGAKQAGKIRPTPVRVAAIGPCYDRLFSVAFWGLIRSLRSHTNVSRCPVESVRRRGNLIA